MLSNQKKLYLLKDILRNVVDYGDRVIFFRENSVLYGKSTIIRHR